VAVVSFSSASATWLVPILLLGWPFVVAVLFARLRARDAVVWAFVIGFLFLPEGAYVVQGLPEYTKQTATSLAVLLCSLAFDGARMLRWRPHWLDLPVFVWCLGRVATSLSNGLGFYDGLSNLLLQFFSWGLPYWIGRTYLSDSDGVRALARGVLVGGLLYLPLCLWELRFSPQLHSDLFGFRAVHFKMMKRYGGYRPIVFTQSSLLVAMWMAAATVSCAWLSASGAVRRVFGMPTRALLLPLAITTVLCKALGAITLMIAGLGMLFCARRLRWAMPVIAVLAIAGAYPALRGSGLMDADALLSASGVLYDADRQNSLAVRLTSEDLYIDHVAERPILGWGGWGRGDIVVEGIGRSIPDGLWVIALSRAGWLAVAALALMYLTPVLALVRRPVASWTTPEVGPFAALAVVLLLYWVDCLSNAMLNPILILSIGGATGWVAESNRAIRTQPAPEPLLAEEKGVRSRIPSAALGRALRGRRPR
jgi:hypothetical protein